MTVSATLLDAAAKDALKKAVRGLRAQLINELTEAAKSEYRLDLSIDKAKLPAGRHARRERLEARLDEQIRGAEAPKGKGAHDALRERFLREAITEAASTWLNRLVFLRILEHHGLSSPAVVTGGWNSPAYAQELTHYAGPLATDDTRGYRALLDVVFGELSLELPGLFGPVGLTPLFPMPAATLRDVIDTLNEPVLNVAWGDDTTLGWVYQYWNDPERERLDEKISGGGKIAPHEIASKTQMFTERYMVEWLLDNSLGLTWLALCKKHGWTPDAEQVLPALEERRIAWRAKREAGEVALDALMPVAEGLESDWRYYVPQPLPESAVQSAPDSIRSLKLLDPACGSGHFLVIAFDRLAAMHREEARHRGETWSDERIAQTILAENLYGIDIDARAIQIAAAALWLKAKVFAPEARLARMNLVAPALRLGNLPANDPALVRLATDLEREVGLPVALSERLVKSLAGVDHLGTLLRVDQAVTQALVEAEQEYAARGGKQGDLYAGFAEVPLGTSDEAKATVLEKLEAFLTAHSGSEDLGVRLDGEQLAAGVRFVRIVREDTYDVVIGNPPYQGLSKTSGFEYVVKNYPRGKADLYAAFMERGIELAKEGGLSALLTMRGWMFLGQFEQLRKYILDQWQVVSFGDIDKGGFEEMTTSQLISVALVTVRKLKGPAQWSVALQPTGLDEKYWGRDRTVLKRAAILAQVRRHEFDPRAFAVIEGEPIVYWWTEKLLTRYAATPKLGEVSSTRIGLRTSDNGRYLRVHWELRQGDVNLATKMLNTAADPCWIPYIKGASGRRWIEPVTSSVRWARAGLAVKVSLEHRYNAYPQSSEFYLRPGVAFTMIGSAFGARIHRVPSIIGDMGSSTFPPDISSCVTLLNSSLSRSVLESLNPTIHFQPGDVARLPLWHISNSNEIFATIECAFTEHESHREPSVEFRAPGASPWRYAQDWAQRSVDRAEGEPLPPYTPEYDPPAPEAHVSFALGVALGRFGANGEGILDTAPASALPAGLLFVGPGDRIADSLSHPATAPLREAWEPHRAAITQDTKTSLADYLRKDFFAYHKGLYENRPIYFPLSSEKKTFVAWVSIHRFTDDTLKTLLADHLHPIARQLDAELADVNVTRASSDKKTAQQAEKQFGVLTRLRTELATFITDVTACAERGAPPTDPACPKREVDATFHMDLDDGVMINSAALWPLLAPQWNEPKKWWKQLALAEGKKDYDWAHLAQRYFPTRVAEKCKADPSLAVAHGCFWKLHPAKAYAWELRLQDEIRPDFTIDEAESNACRSAFLTSQPLEAKAAREKEEARRERARKKADEAEDAHQDADAETDAEEASA